MKYVTFNRPKVWFDDYSAEPLRTITVVETDGMPQETGLFTADGLPLYRVNDRPPLGFRLRERS